MPQKKIADISSGIYFTETDLTFVEQAVGEFSGGQIAITEKGPAFVPVQSKNFAERELRLGGLNPTYRSSYLAKYFLDQASNYKEVRVLGLEGYTDTKAFIIQYAIPTGAQAAATWVNPLTKTSLATPLVADQESIAVILKPRLTTFTGLLAVKSVEISAVAPATAPTEEAFTITWTFSDDSTKSIVASLRPESVDYILNIFGTDPRDGAKIFGSPAPLWVDTIFPSRRRKLTISTNAAYYYPGETNSGNSFPALELVAGETVIDSTFAYPQLTVIDATNATPIVLQTSTNHGYSNGDKVVAQAIGGNIAANGTFWITVTGTDTFELYTDSARTIPAEGTGAYTTGGNVRLAYDATIEAEALNFSDIIFQTPVTPWLVSNANSSGEVKRLFKVWSISDGEAANTEIKIEIANVDPTGNGGNGSFDLFVRSYSSREDLDRTIVESFTNLTLDPNSTNYLPIRIGDGDEFEIRSQYIFVEMSTEDLRGNELPFGFEGIPNITGGYLPSPQWTPTYDVSKPIAKQQLGFANNQINMFQTLPSNILNFFKIEDENAVRGKGFHLNPDNNANIDANLFIVAPATTYQTATLAAVSAAEKIRRSKFVVPMYGGFDGFNVYSERTWNDATSKDFEALQMAIEVLADNENLFADFSILTTPDINYTDHPVAVEAILDMVQTRGDAMYIIDQAYNEISDAQEAADLIKFSSIRNSYASSYHPWLQAKDSQNRRNVWLPPSVLAAATIAATASNENVFQPPAGPLRTVTDNIVRTRKRMKIEDRNILKKVGINPISDFPGSGIEITESRTLQENFSALSFIHNRLLLGYAKKALNQTLRPLLHQLDKELVATAFIDTLTPIFDRIKKANGLDEFAIVIVENEDRTTLTGQIRIQALYPVERIIVDFVLTNDGVEFSE